MSKKELIDLCKKGDIQALSLLYQTYSGKMMKVCLRYVSDKQIAQDLLHDSFIIIFTSIDSLRHPDKLESWMGMITKNISLRYLNQRNAINIIPLSEIEEQEESVDTPLPEGFLSYDAMIGMIERLPEGYRKVFKLSVLDGLSHKEIGSLLGIAPHSSSSQLSRAKEMLRKLIAQYNIIILLLLVLILPFAMWLTMREVSTIKKTVSEFETEKENEQENVTNDSTITCPANIRNIQYTHLESVGDTIKHESVFKDSTIQFVTTKDTVYITKNQATPKVNREHLRFTNITNSSNKKENWSLILVYSGGNGQTSTQRSLIPGDVSSGMTEIVENKKVHHYSPITASLSLHKKINEHWGIETGIRYTHLRSDFATTNRFHSEVTQKINYLGIPVKGVAQLWKHGKMSVYTSAGIALDIPIKTTLEEVRIDNGQVTITKQHTVSAPPQWSINFGIGFQYQITPSIGIYAEPGLNYYFDNGSKLKTIRQEQPVDITLPVGIRFSW